MNPKLALPLLAMALSFAYAPEATAEPSTVNNQEVHFPPHMRQERRQELTEILQESADEASKHWDFFDWQWENLLGVTFTTFTGSTCGMAPPSPNGVHLYLDTTSWEGGRCSLTPGTMVHETAHSWYFTLKPKDQRRLLKEMRKITGRKYKGYGLFRNRMNGECNGDLAKWGVTDCYALAGVIEDISQIAEFVYELNHPSTYSNSTPEPNKEQDMYAIVPMLNDVRGGLPKIKAKIKLLRGYSFFSQKESGVALTRIREYEARRRSIRVSP